MKYHFNTNVPDYSNIRDITTIEEYDPDTTVLDRENKLIYESVVETRQELQNLINTPPYREYLENFHPLPRKYVDDSIWGEEEEFDRHYGLSHDLQSEKFTLANTIVDIKGPDFLVNNIRYPGTTCLYELLFKNRPIEGTQSGKYKTIIKPYLMKYNILKHSSAVSGTLSFRKPPPPKTTSKTLRGGISR